MPIGIQPPPPAARPPPPAAATVMPPPPAAARLPRYQPPLQSSASHAATLHQLRQPRSNSAATQVGYNVPQVLGQAQSANNKVVYDMVQVSNANTHAMATSMAASFAESAQTTNACAMQTVHALQVAHAASSGNIIAQLAESTRQALGDLKNVVSQVIRAQHAQPMRHAPVATLPPPLPMPPPNWMMSGGSSGSGGQNPTPVQWIEPAWHGQVGTWAENPTTHKDWPGWQMHQTWTPIMPPPTGHINAAENEQPPWTWEEHRSMETWGTTEDDTWNNVMTSSSGSCAPLDLGQLSAALAACSSDEDEDPATKATSSGAMDGSDQQDWGIRTDSIGTPFLNYRWLYGIFNLCVI